MVAAQRSGATVEVFMRAIIMPPTIPPANATRDRSSVQRSASKMNRSSFHPNCRMGGLPGPPTNEDKPLDPIKRQANGNRHQQIEAGRDEVELEGAKGRRL